MCFLNFYMSSDFYVISLSYGSSAAAFYEGVNTYPFCVILFARSIISFKLLYCPLLLI